jgi:hypothetical protein
MKTLRRAAVKGQYMDTTPSASSGASYPHAVKFYSDDRSLGRTVAEFLAPGLLEGSPAIVIVTPDHRVLIEAELEKRGVRVDQLERDGDVQIVDAEEMLARFMVGNQPDPVKFHAAVDELIARACQDRPPCPVRAYGEMVDVLWKHANAEGAIALEMLWNRVATEAQFSLLCGYAVGNFYKEVSSGPTFEMVCDQHNHILPEERSA